MANISIKFECSECFEEHEIEKDLDARNRIDIRNVIREAENKGWHIGLITLCPECAKQKRDKCKNCKHFENKSMCPPTCTLMDCVTLSDDYCINYESNSATPNEQKG